MSVLKRVKRMLANWLLDGGVDVGDPLKIRPDYVTFPPLSADPTLSTGTMWFRGDLGRFRYSPDGVIVKDFSTVLALSELAIDVDKDWAGKNIYNVQIDGLMYPFFGDGSDGNVTISSNVTLSRDMNYRNLTINGGCSLDTANYVVYVSRVCTINGVLHANGRGAGSGSAGSLLSVNIPYKNAAVSVQTGGGGGGGGSASDSGYGGGGGAGGGVVKLFCHTLILNGSIQARGINGANGYGNYGAGGGGGGGGGGTVLVEYVLKTGTGTMDANGGTGGSGGWAPYSGLGANPGSPGGAGGGGGAGGSGGSVPSGNGGNGTAPGGAGGGGGACWLSGCTAGNGGNGAAGWIREYDLKVML